MRTLTSTATAAAFFMGLLSIGPGCGDDTSGTTTATSSSGSGGSSTSSTTTSGSSSSVSGSGSSTSSGSGGSGGGAGGNSGDCDTNGDCPGSECVEVTPGGFRVCKVDYPEATMCQGVPEDECCNSTECAVGKCYPSPLAPYCGGPAPLRHNVCGVDMCANDAECGAMQICAPAGTLDRVVAACAGASCKLDKDCGDEAGGSCATVDNACCGGAVGLYCVYPSDGCRTGGDCPGGYCEITPEGRTHCVAGVPICPQ